MDSPSSISYVRRKPGDGRNNLYHTKLTNLNSSSFCVFLFITNYITATPKALIGAYSDRPRDQMARRKFVVPPAEY